MKVLVPVNFTAHSRAAARFAFQWAYRLQAELVFLYVADIKRPGRFDDEYYIQYYKDELAASQKKLLSFVSKINKKIQEKPGTIISRVIEGSVAYEAILEYCEKHTSIEYVVVSTGASGALDRLLAKNTRAFVANSKLPVIFVPKTYRAQPLTRILYTSDLLCYEEEIKTVVHLARGLKIPVDILHYTTSEELKKNGPLIERSLQIAYKHGITAHILPPDLDKSLSDNILRYIEKNKPSMITMFTEQGRLPFQKIVNPSKSRELTFRTKIPLIVFRKPAKNPATTHSSAFRQGLAG